MIPRTYHEADMAEHDEARERRIDWWKHTGKIKLTRVAESCGTTREYIRMLVYGHRRPRAGLAQALGEHSGLSRKWWRPDVWG